jgi:phosphopantothenoylcysteine decarboxylase/phosphopantothenate--cysteine ligase
VLITCGPTHEPIDAVRFIGNRSSGKMGLAIAAAAAARGWTVRLLAGPGVDAAGLKGDTRVSVGVFRTAEDLRGLLRDELASADVLVMAAAVADFRPKVSDEALSGKIRRTQAGLSLELEPTPDLLAECGRSRRGTPPQVIVGFALEPLERMLASAAEKLARKRVDAIVANPLETMDSPTIQGVLVTAGGHERPPPPSPAEAGSGDSGISKEAFAAWLIERIDQLLRLARNAG